MTGRSASAFCNLVVTSLNTTVKPAWSCGTVLADTGRLILDHRRNHTHARFSVKRDNVASMTCSEFTATS